MLAGWLTAAAAAAMYKLSCLTMWWCDALLMSARASALANKLSSMPPNKLLFKYSKKEFNQN